MVIAPVPTGGVGYSALAMAGQRVSAKNSGAAMEALQSEIAFQGQSLQELNDALAAQQDDILLLKRQLALLSGQIRALRHLAEDPADGSDNDPPPPHY
jgi:uncharacterized coiled-coil protein SlyX